MPEESTSPAVYKTAFSCPHCGAYTTQKWYMLHAIAIDEQQRTPGIPVTNAADLIENDREMSREAKEELKLYVTRRHSGQVFLTEEDTKFPVLSAENLYLSECYNCKKYAVWTYQSLVFPPSRAGTPPNADLPEEIRTDFEEARAIVNLSPRGAAALLRLCLQKLCKHLGEKGERIDDDIASLVAKGLNPVIQKSLDIVRVIGNESVHPGELDLKDDSETALALFDLVNAVVDQMISHRLKVEGLYERLPEGKRKAIEKRDKKGKGV
jgi:hypothetical protein